MANKFSVAGRDSKFKLPDAKHGQMIEIAPVVAVSAAQIVVTGQKVADVADLDRDSGYLNIPALEERLRDEKKRWEFIHQSDPGSKTRPCSSRLTL